MKNLSFILIVFSILFVSASLGVDLNRENDEMEEIISINVQESVRKFFFSSHLPGFSTSFTQNGLNYFSSVGLNVLQKVIQSTTIPDSEGEVKSPVGKLKYWLSNAQLSGTQFNGASIKIVEGQGLLVTVTGFSTTCVTHWHYRRNAWPHISGTGTATVQVGGNIQMLVSLSANNEHLQSHVIRCDVSLYRFDIHVSGKGSKIYNFILKMAKKSVQNAVTNMLKGAISQNTENGLNKALANFLVLQKIKDDVVFDIGMVQNPQFGASKLTLFESGEAYRVNNQVECPQSVCPQRNLPTSTSNQMLEMFMSDFVTNSFSNVFYQEKMFQMRITPDEVPASSWVKLNTDFFQNTIPQLPQRFPHCDMTIVTYATQPPSSVFTPKGANINAIGDMEVWVNVNGTLKEAFVLTGNFAASGNATLSGHYLKPLVTYVKSAWTLKSSNIGNFPVSTLNFMFDFFGKSFVIPLVNQRIQNGIKLPSVKGINFVNPSLKFSDNILSISTDVNYTPQN
eukprot:TRINITY_DN3217_c0_g1_i1.p1 TRINITY_DN3217_c0_g1~~TRINITY_DN3217_c0_g1_i1.p1  ORF type:complete len:509 (-),score=179.12 TRINITY_DN3217_c0_g1_i1:164-1690(-)